MSWRNLPLAALLLAGCPAPQSEPPPPLAKSEISPAPPRALGARAGGTDAAPRPDGLGLGSPLAPSPAPFVPDAGAPTPDGTAPDGGTAAAPDAGMAL